jgi:type II secretory pathway component PulK
MTSKQGRGVSPRSGPPRPGSSIRFKAPPRHGVIFITALGIIVILAGLVLAYAMSMRSESLASGNRLAYAQADAIEQAAEAWTLAQIDSYPADSLTVTETPAEAIQVGTGYFWILHPDPTQWQTYSYGITDEAGKVNLNSAAPTSSLTGFQLANLPYLEDETDVADNIVAWAGEAPDADGTPSNYYESLQEPYDDRLGATLNPGIESIDELLMVENLTPQMLYGEDLNRNGVLETSEQNANGTVTLQSGGDDPRGFFNYVTCYSKVPGTNPNAQTSVNINTLNNPNSLSALSTALTNAGVSNASQIVNNIQSALPRGNRAPTWDLGGFYSASGMTPAEFGLVFDELVTAKSRQIPPIIPLNVNTASAQAMACLPTLSQGDAANLADAQASGINTGNLSWFFNALQPAQIVNVAPYITDRSYQFSADIVAVSGDGRSFKRVRIVIDGSGLAPNAATATPAQIIYRKDLTSLGWPLDPAIRVAMRQGRPPPDAGSTSNNSGSGIVQ